MKIYRGTRWESIWSPLRLIEKRILLGIGQFTKTTCIISNPRRSGMFIIISTFYDIKTALFIRQVIDR